jgi:hypothetical protein
MKICPVVVQLFRADGQTDGRTEVMKLIVAFRNFANVPKIGTDVMALDSLTVYYYFIHVNHIILCF